MQFINARIVTGEGDIIENGYLTVAGSVIAEIGDMKDFSETLPGHGGVLDRLDSVLLCAPVVLAFCILALS